MINASAFNAYNANNIDDLKRLINQLISIIGDLQRRVGELENNTKNSN